MFSGEVPLEPSMVAPSEKSGSFGQENHEQEAGGGAAHGMGDHGGVRSAGAVRLEPPPSHDVNRKTNNRYIFFETKVFLNCFI